MKKSESNKLSVKQRKAIFHLIACSTVKEALKKTGISHQTYFHWIQQSLFQDALRDAREKVFEDAFDFLKFNVKKGAETLVDLLDAESESVRRQTANDILNHLQKHREINDIQLRKRLWKRSRKRSAENLLRYGENEVSSKAKKT